MLRVVHYLNQFFGQIGGEEKADVPPIMREGPVGPGMAFAAEIKDFGDIVGTVVCGDNYMAEGGEKALGEVLERIDALRPDALIAGPAFNAGRYGPACGAVCKAAREKFGIPVVTGMYLENPGAEIYASSVLIAAIGPTAAGMRQAVVRMSGLLRKGVLSEPLGPPAWEGYIPQGIRKNTREERRGASRAVSMLLDVLAGKDPETELALPRFEPVAPAKPLANLQSARIALVTEGGLVPRGNPDRLESSRTAKFLRYELEGAKELSGALFQSVHGGYDNTFVNARPDRLLPVDVLRDLVEEGVVGAMADYFYTTTGNGTSLENSRVFGRTIAELLLRDNVQGVLLTST